MVTERHQKQPQMRGIGSNEAASRIDTRVVQRAWGVRKCTPGAYNFACSGRVTPLTTRTVGALLGRSILIASTSFQLRSRGILHAKDCLSTVCVPGVCRACYRVCTAILLERTVMIQSEWVAAMAPVGRCRSGEVLRLNNPLDG